MRIMNRLVAALKELKSMKNVSGILHNCATLSECLLETSPLLSPLELLELK